MKTTETLSNLKFENVSVIYSYKDYDCTNGGVTSKKRSVVVAYGSEEAWNRPDADFVLCDGTAGQNIVIKDKEHYLEVLGRGGYLKITTKQKPNLIGPMDGGNYVVNTNGLGMIRVPVHVHDRFETEEQYRVLSS